MYSTKRGKERGDMRKAINKTTISKLRGKNSIEKWIDQESLQKKKVNEYWKTKGVIRVELKELRILNMSVERQTLKIYKLLSKKISLGRDKVSNFCLNVFFLSMHKPLADLFSKAISNVAQKPENCQPKALLI